MVIVAPNECRPDQQACQVYTPANECETPVWDDNFQESDGVAPTEAVPAAGADAEQLPQELKRPPVAEGPF
jgi:hypothetical protein